MFSILCQPQPPHRLIQVDQNVILDFQQVAYIKSVKHYCCAQMGFKAILLSACNIPNAHRNHSWHPIVWTACSVCTHDIMHNYSDCHWHWMDPWHNSLEWISLFRFTPFSGNLRRLGGNLRPFVPNPAGSTWITLSFQAFLIILSNMLLLWTFY